MGACGHRYAEGREYRKEDLAKSRSKGLIEKEHMTYVIRTVGYSMK